MKSPLLEIKEDIISRPKYSTTEETYIKGLRIRMETARNQRDQAHDAFDGMSYAQWYDLNEKTANTFIALKKNKEDTNFQSGTVRQKLFALLAGLVNLNLSGDISAYENEGLEVQSLGDAMEDIILKTNEYDGDEEKKLLRQYELLKHGTVFVEEVWDKRTKKSKKLSKKFDGKVSGAEWTEKLEDAFARPSRHLVSGLNVYLGDISKYDMGEQPFIFTVETKPYDEAKTLFGEWERWDNVPRALQEFNPAENEGLNPNWRILELQKDHVEIVRYQDKWNNEFAVVLNGVLMTPIGLPLPWGYEDYNVAQQNLEPINAQFSYGKSLVARIRNKVALMDELLRLAVLKTQKSFMPPYINISGRVLSNRVLMPGKISYGIPPNSLVPINDKEAQGMTQAEMAMITEIQTSIDNETTSPLFSGNQPSSGGATATEIVELQRQAKMILGLTIFAMSMLEWKLEWLRLKNLLANWFTAEDEVVDSARGVLKGKYRQTSVDRPIEGRGQGRRIVIPTKDIPTGDTIMKTEDALTKEQGMPVQLIFVDPDEVCSAKLIWQIVERPKEKKTSETSKLLFRAFIADILPLGPNISYLQEKAATVWEDDPKKLFAPNPQPQMPSDGTEGATGDAMLSPRVSMPSAEKAVGQQLQQQLKTNG